VSSLPALMELDCVQVDPVERVAAQRTERMMLQPPLHSSLGDGGSEPTPRTRAKQAEAVVEHVEAVYNAAMLDANGKLEEMQSDFTARMKSRAQALKDRRKNLLLDDDDESETA
jgi:hypothetical protein